MRERYSRRASGRRLPRRISTRASLAHPGATHDLPRVTSPLSGKLGYRLVSLIVLTCQQDYEWDIIDVELSGLGKDGDLGFELSGGRDEPCYPNDYSIYVTAVKKGSVAEGKIK